MLRPCGQMRRLLLGVLIVLVPVTSGGFPKKLCTIRMITDYGWRQYGSLRSIWPLDIFS